jgi:hypothetical protein
MINYRLKYKVSEISKILKVEKKLVKDWAYHFAEFLNPKANPEKGEKREFTPEDICVLCYISYYWEDEPDFENIKYGLYGGDQFESPFTDLVTETTPIFREYSEEILTKNIWMIGGMVTNADIMSLANSYKMAGDILVEVGLKNEQNKDLIYPAIFNYRHSTELYLKAVLPNYKDTHKLRNLYSDFKLLIKQECNEDIPSWFENIVIAFDEFDPNGTSFRYGDKVYRDELFVDLAHIKIMMEYFAKSMSNIKKTL